MRCCRRAGAGIRASDGGLAGAREPGRSSAHGLVNYDTLYSLVWGRELAQGRTPDFDAALAPTPHPLATLARRPARAAEHRRRRGRPRRRGAHGQLVLGVPRARRARLGRPTRSARAWFGPWAGRRRGGDRPHAPAGARLRRAGVRRHPVRRARARRAARGDAATDAPARRCSCCSPLAGPAPARGVAVLGRLPRCTCVGRARRSARSRRSRRSPPPARCCGRCTTWSSPAPRSTR